jgi:hypothetical protein
MRLRRGSKLLRSVQVPYGRSMQQSRSSSVAARRSKGSKKKVLTQKRGDFLYDEKTNS